MNLAEVFNRLRTGLAPLGIELGTDVLGIWLDRERHGGEPLPDAAIQALAQWAASLAPQDARQQ